MSGQKDHSCSSDISSIFRFYSDKNLEFLQFRFYDSEKCSLKTGGRENAETVTYVKFILFLCIYYFECI
jgi:hypothetical protein